MLAPLAPAVCKTDWAASLAGTTLPKGVLTLGFFFGALPSFASFALFPANCGPQCGPHIGLAQGSILVRVRLSELRSKRGEAEVRGVISARDSTIISSTLNAVSSISSVPFDANHRRPSD
jgi:hypothetical protein